MFRWFTEADVRIVVFGYLEFEILPGFSRFLHDAPHANYGLPFGKKYPLDIFTVNRRSTNVSVKDHKI